MNLQIVEAVKCKGILTQVSACLSCQWFITRDEILGQIECRNENKKSRKEQFEEQYKNFYKDGGIIEFGNKNE